MCRVPLFIFAILLSAEFARAASPRIKAKRNDCHWIPVTQDECAGGSDNPDYDDKLVACNYGQTPETYCEADKQHDIVYEIDNWDINNCNGRYDVYFYTCKKNNGPGDDNAKYVKNVDKPLRGYDIKTGYPLDAEDKGWRAQIFEATYKAENSEKQVNGDGTFFEPDGTAVYDCSKSCDFSTSYEEIYGTRSLMKSLSVSASVTGALPAAAAPTGVGGSFSLSAGFQKVKTQNSEKHSVTTLATSTCCAYKLSIQSYQASPGFTKQFQYAVESLPEVYDKEKYARFVKIFGTSYSIETDMGAQMIQTTTYSQDKWNEGIKRNWNIKANATVTFPQGNVGGAVGIDRKKEQKTFEKYVNAEFKMIVKGGAPPEAGKSTKEIDGQGIGGKVDPDDWLAHIITDPAPVMIRLHPISDLLDHDSYGTKFEPHVAATLDAKRKNLEEYYKEYCRDGACEEPMPDKSPYEIKYYEQEWAAKRSKKSSLITRKVWKPLLCPKYYEDNYVVQVNAWDTTHRGIVDIELVCRSDMEREKNQGSGRRYTIYPGRKVDPERNLPKYGGITGIKVYHQKTPYYGVGVVNFELEDAENSDFKSINGKRPQGGSLRKSGYSRCGEDEVVVGMQVQTKQAQGIIDMRVICRYIGTKFTGKDNCDGDYRVVDEDTGKGGDWYAADGEVECDAAIIGPELLEDSDDDKLTCFCRSKRGIENAMSKEPKIVYDTDDFEGKKTEAASALGFISTDSLLVKSFAILGGTSILFWLGQYMLTKPAYKNIGEQNEV